MIVSKWWPRFAGGFVLVSAVGLAAGQALKPPPATRIDYLTFAQGAIPVRIGGAGATLGTNFEHAVRLIDGDPTGFPIVDKGSATTDTEFVYVLPAATTFDRFAIPNILETPSPSQTFTRLVEVFGSATGPDDGYVRLASATLRVHPARGRETELKVAVSQPVRWIKLRLVGGLSLPLGEGALEFSEIIGNGKQDAVPLADHFRGAWQGAGVVIQLQQDGPVVTGCYDTNGQLTGTVTGNILRATGFNRSDKTQSAFILSVAPDGELRGVRSSNHGPFRLYAGPAATKVVPARCAVPPPATLGCGAVIHGITFEFDSAEMRPESGPILSRLYDGLSADRSATIVIEGHTSSEGTNEYNQSLSDRRAKAVVADLVRRGIDARRLTALGMGEMRPIAANVDESGRAMNRRVEVKCR